jgi:hypothetical protein
MPAATSRMMGSARSLNRIVATIEACLDPRRDNPPYNSVLVAGRVTLAPGRADEAGQVRAGYVEHFHERAGGVPTRHAGGRGNNGIDRPRFRVEGRRARDGVTAKQVGGVRLAGP